MVGMVLAFAPKLLPPFGIFKLRMALANLLGFDKLFNADATLDTALTPSAILPNVLFAAEIGSKDIFITPWLIFI
jgi:hypothetical protein